MEVERYRTTHRRNVLVYDVLEDEVGSRAGERRNAADVGRVGDGEGETLAELGVVSAVVVLVFVRLDVQHRVRRSRRATSGSLKEQSCLFS